MKTMSKDFNPKDTKYDKTPKEAVPRKPGEPDQYDDHNYKEREVRPDGSTVYYYENGVKAIHYPKPDSNPRYHKDAAKHHAKESETAIDSKKYKKALSHLKALTAHSQALDKFKGDEKPVDKLAKEFGGTVAVASDPGVFTPTYSGNNKKGKSGVKKLDDYLKKQLEHKRELVSLVKDVQEEMNKADVPDLVPRVSQKSIEKDDTEDFFENNLFDLDPDDDDEKEESEE